MVMRLVRKRRARAVEDAAAAAVAMGRGDKAGSSGSPNVGLFQFSLRVRSCQNLPAPTKGVVVQRATTTSRLVVKDADGRRGARTLGSVCLDLASHVGQVSPTTLYLQLTPKGGGHGRRLLGKGRARAEDGERVGIVVDLQAVEVKAQAKDWEVGSEMSYFSHGHSGVSEEDEDEDGDGVEEGGNERAESGHHNDHKPEHGTARRAGRRGDESDSDFAVRTPFTSPRAASRADADSRSLGSNSSGRTPERVPSPLPLARIGGGGGGGGGGVEELRAVVQRQHEEIERLVEENRRLRNSARQLRRQSKQFAKPGAGGRPARDVVGLQDHLQVHSDLAAAMNDNIALQHKVVSLKGRLATMCERYTQLEVDLVQVELPDFPSKAPPPNARFGHDVAQGVVLRGECAPQGWVWYECGAHDTYRGVGERFGMGADLAVLMSMNRLSSRGPAKGDKLLVWAGQDTGPLVMVRALEHNAAAGGEWVLLDDGM